uniref:T-box domain-containing protein n=1 Tax=Panagrolaimus superbus TaxID=310955 RepID=A0A914YNS4_9BILA
MFPTVKIRLEGCDPDLLYYVFLDVVPVDDRRYRYVYNKSSWLTAGKAEPSPDTRIYLHPDSPFPGRQLASQIELDM